jgi:hypothetical protein
MAWAVPSVGVVDAEFAEIVDVVTTVDVVIAVDAVVDVAVDVAVEVVESESVACWLSPEL